MGLNTLEHHLLDALVYIREELATRGLKTPVEFRETMGEIRDAIKKLENKRLGCPLGRHATKCLCQDPLIK